MNAPVQPFSALVGAIVSPSRAIASQAASTHRTPLNPMTRDRAVLNALEPLGVGFPQRVERGPSIAAYFAAKAARGEHGTYDDTRLVQPRGGSR